MIDFDKVLFRRIKYKEHFVGFDKFGTEDSRYRFEYDIEIAKCYTLKGVLWEMKLPSATLRDANLFVLISQAIEYATTKFPQYSRLEEELFRKDFWIKLG